MAAPCCAPRQPCVSTVLWGRLRIHPGNKPCLMLDTPARSSDVNSCNFKGAVFKLERKRVSMFNYFVLALTTTAITGMALGAAFHHKWRARTARHKRRIPAKWNLNPRPVMTDDEHEVWQWMRRAFFEHHVLVKLPVIRFMSPRNTQEGEQSHEILNGVYCTFTVCATDGTVIGCLDVPGRSGLRASSRNLKQKLFAECGLAYAVVRAGNLPTLEAMRAAFLGEIDLTDDEPAFGQPPLARPAPPDDEADDMATVPDTMRTASGATLESLEAIHEVDMKAVAEARNSLRAKLERNRKVRFTNFDPLSTGTGIVHDDAEEHGYAVKWEDSFISAEEFEALNKGS